MTPTSLPPPPPPPPPPPQSTIQSVIKIPPKCFPIIQGLMFLQDKGSIFDRWDRKALQDSDVGRHLARVLYQCRSERDVYRTSSKRTADNNGITLQSCLIKHACPQRWKSFQECWTTMPQHLVQEFHEAGMLHFLCLSEKQAIERCVGDLVSKAVREATVEDPDFHDDFSAR